MAIVDPEKDAIPVPSSSCSSSTPKVTAAGDVASDQNQNQNQNQGKEATPSLYSQAPSHTSAGSDSDPLSPLEHALTPDLRTEAEHALARAEPALSNAQTRTSVGSAASRPPDFEIVFDPEDAENPRNWPLWYRSWIVFCVSYNTWVVVLYSTAYTAATPGIMAEFNVDSSSIVTLGLTTYLLGLAIGSVVVAPMSELYGRRPVYIGCLFVFVLLMIPCGLATSLAELIIVRFFG